MKPTRNAVIASIQLLTALLIGFFFWTVVALVHDELDDRYWAVHGHPRADLMSVSALQWPLVLTPVLLVVLWRLRLSRRSR